MQSMLHKILQARVYDVVQKTPLDRAPGLSTRNNNNIWLKREDLQPGVFSFKSRGAYNRMRLLNQDERRQGVICSSAGNHAQGVALAARKLGINALIVMPKTTPDIKVVAVQRLGGKVILHGVNYDAAQQHAKALAESERRVFIPPYDDLDVIAGQGTVGKEILDQLGNDLDAVFIPVGGGGLIAGIACYIKEIYPEVKIIAIEPEESASLKAALQAGKPVQLPSVGIFADGVAVRKVGQHSFDLVKDRVDEIITVNNDAICAAIKDIFEDTRTLVEPAGALAVAGLKAYVKKHQVNGLDLVAITSGANVNFDRLRHVAERAELGEHREAIFAAILPEQPGSFLKFCQCLDKRSITEFNYRYHSDHAAQVFVGIQVQDYQSGQDLYQKLKKLDYQILDLSDNELAKLHTRYMVGGHTNASQEEVIIRFEFPELPGALEQFLTDLGSQWNISLCHYRNHGADYGRILMGLQAPKDQQNQLFQHLETLCYRFTIETDNPAFSVFLSALNASD